MFRIVLGLIFCFLALYAEEESALPLTTPEQFSALNHEPDSLIAGLISPLSGFPVLRQIDLVAKGAQEIVLSRVYISPQMPSAFPRHKKSQAEYDKRFLAYYLQQNYLGWNYFPHFRLDLHPQTYEARVTDLSGSRLEYRFSRSGAHLASYPYAMSNVAGDTPSGKYDPRNVRLSLEDSGSKIVVSSPDGSLRSYFFRNGWTREGFKVYLLEKERLPSGKILKYAYDEKLRMRSVTSFDPKERYPYATLHLSGSGRNVHFVTNSEVAAEYSYQVREFAWKIRDTMRETDGRGISPQLLTSVSSPFYREETLEYCPNFLLREFRGKNETFQAIHQGFGQEEPLHFKVHKLLLPVGPEETWTPVYEITYDPPVAGQKGGATLVKNSDGTSIRYHFSPKLLLSLIEYLGQDGALKKEKACSYYDNHWLKAVELREHEGKVLWKRSYEYDPFGNPILERFTGDLPGEGKEESTVIRRSFSDDGRNLLLKESTEEGKIVCFSYLPGTNLLTSRFTKAGSHVLCREFWLYDDCHNLIAAIVDDGISDNWRETSGVTERRIKKYILRQQTPFLHMPERIEELYWEAGEEKSLTKKELLYDKHGNVAEERVYDAMGMHVYTIFKSYNERGDVVSETNALGQTATYTYSAKGERETATSFSRRRQTDFFYDAKGRLKRKRETGDDGIVHAVSSTYDLQDRLIKKEDPFENPTYFGYDPVANQVNQIEKAQISTLGGVPRCVKTHISYDSFGRKIAETDPSGQTTRWSYNAYGSPTQIVYPSGGVESFRYAKNGTLRSYTDREGMTIHYTRDVLGRALSQTYVAKDGTNLGEERFTYSAFQLLTARNKEGQTRHYFYDGAGRKIGEEFCGESVDLSYDALGRVETVSQNKSLFTHYTRDLEGNILEEKKTEGTGETLWQIRTSYTSDGDKETICREIEGKEAIETFAYDSFCRLIGKHEADGSCTQVTYDETVRNGLGQKVLQEKMTDPRGVTTVTTYDALSRSVRTEVVSREGTSLSCEERDFDPSGDLLCQKEGLLHTAYTYTAGHQVATVTRAFGTPEARTTHYTYFPGGSLKTKTLPDGTTLSYAYTPLGFLERVFSSDGTIEQNFAYNKLGHLQSAQEGETTLRRITDPFGNVLREELSNGLFIEKSYDPFHRPLFLRFFDGSEIRYSYDPLFLRRIDRFSSSHELLYTHSFSHFDKSGHLLAEELPFQLGIRHYERDLRGRLIRLTHPSLTQVCLYDRCDNLLETKINGQTHRYGYNDLSQLTEESGHSYAFDSHQNRIRQNEELATFNSLDELVQFGETSCRYSMNGNLISKSSGSATSSYSFDPLGRLTKATTPQGNFSLSYDPLNRLIQKNNTLYLYHGETEIGSFANGALKELRLVARPSPYELPKAIAIEIGGKPLIPFTDSQGHIRSLIDPQTKSSELYTFSAFGQETGGSFLGNPWRYGSKRFDPDLGLIGYGKRFYDPTLGRWLTPDPAGFVDGTNLYAYLMNNPLRYFDRDGRCAAALFFFAAPLIEVCKMAAVTLVALYTGWVVQKEVERYHRNERLDQERVEYYDRASNVETETETEEEKKKKKKPNTNPFDGPVSGEVVVVDEAGNAIKVPEGNWLTGTQDGAWIQERSPDGTKKGRETGTRKDGGHKPAPQHTDPRSLEPHGHVPGVTNPDGTPWLPIYQ